MSDHEAFGTRIRDLRKARQLDQRTLADHVLAGLTGVGGRGFDVSYLSKIENGRVGPPSIPVIVQLAKVLEVDEDELIGLAGKVPSELGKTLRVSEGARMFFRSARDFNLSEQEWRELAEELRRRREKQ